MDRRAFIRKGVLTAGSITTASICGAAPQDEKAAEKAESPKMKYRTLGRTGLKVSELCFGTYGWQDSPVLEAAINSGVNLVCTCTDYQNGAAERAIAPAVAKYRDRLSILSGINCFKYPDEQEILEKWIYALKIWEPTTSNSMFPTRRPRSKM